MTGSERNQLLVLVGLVVVLGAEDRAKAPPGVTPAYSEATNKLRTAADQAKRKSAKATPAATMPDVRLADLLNLAEL